MTKVKNAVLRRPQVESLCGLSRATIYARMKDGTFPLAIKIGTRAVGWRAADVEVWLANPTGYVAPQA